MEKQKPSWIGYIVCILSLSCILHSCVNPDYDLENVVMEEATLFENISLPVGDVEKMTIEKVLFTNGEVPSTIRKDQNGDMHIDLFDDSIAKSFSIPASFKIDDINLQSSYVNLNTGLLAGQNTSSIPETEVTFSSLNGNKPFTLQMPLDITEDLPAEIHDVRSLTLDASVECLLSTSSTPITIKYGSKITFPEYVYIEHTSSSTVYTVLNDHVISFLTNYRIAASSPLAIKVGLKKIELPAGSVTGEDGKRKFSINDHVTVTGDFSFNTKDIAIVPEKVSLGVSANLSRMSVKNAELSLDVNMNLPDQEMEIGEIPDLLKGDNVCVDLYNPQISMRVANYTPLSCSMTADLTATLSNGNDTRLSITKEDGVSMPAHTICSYLISRRQMTPGSSGTVNIVKPAIGELIKNVPDVIKFNNCNIITSKDFVNVLVGQNYSVAFDYSVSSPLAFGEDLSLSFTQDVENLGLELDVNVKSVVFEMNLINSIPVDFNLSAICLDALGNEVSETKVTLDKEIKAGSHVSPTTTAIKLELKNPKGKMNVDGLRLVMKATAPEAEFVGVPLNVDQGFEIKDIVLTLPDGIGVEF